MFKKLLTYGFGESVARGFNWLILALLPLFVTDPGEYGLIGLIVALEGLGVSIFMAGQDRSVLRYYYHDEQPALLLFTVYVLSLLALVALGVAVSTGAIFSEKLAGIPFTPHLFLLVGVILFMNMNKIYLAVLRVEELPGKYVRLRIGFAALKLILVLALVTSLAGGMAYLSGALGAALVVFLITLPQVLKRIKVAFDATQLKRLWVFGWPFMFHVMGGNILIFADRFMLEWYRDLSVVGAYTLAYTLGGAVSFIYGAMSIYFEPLIYKKAEDSDAAEKLLGLYSTACIFFGALWGVGILIALPILIDQFWGEAYESIRYIVPIILAAHLLMPIYLQANYRLTLHEKTRILATGTVIAAIVNVLFNLYLIPKMGAEGAAIATFLSLLVLCGIVFFFSMRYTGVKWGALKSTPVLITTLIATSVLVFMPVENISIPVFLCLAVVTCIQLVNASPRLVAYLKR